MEAIPGVGYGVGKDGHQGMRDTIGVEAGGGVIPRDWREGAEKAGV